MNTNVHYTEEFEYRHLGSEGEALQTMLKEMNVSSVEELIEQTIPASIRLKKPLSLPEPLTEYQYLHHIKKIAQKNKIFKSYIGLGYYNTITPSVILRNVFENPGWYTAYTPYQAEIAQGRLEALLNFQTMVCDLTGMSIANASLLDEATAAAEAMFMLHSEQQKTLPNAHTILVSDKVFPQTIEVLHTRANPVGITVKVVDIEKETDYTGVFAILLQYPDKTGEVKDYTELVQKAKQNKVKIIVASDLLALTLLTPPGEWGADVVVGNSQRFGVPLGYGGPHAAFFATHEEYKRSIPGRIIGVTIDAQGNPALRMALQTREQHIKREKATSNICTAQALLANMASFYAVYHGPKGLKNIAARIHAYTQALAKLLSEIGCTVRTIHYFDTLNLDHVDTNKVKSIAEANEVNFWYNPDGSINLSLDETTQIDDVLQIANIFAQAQNQTLFTIEKVKGAIHAADKLQIPDTCIRKSEYLTHPVFNRYHTEHEMLRYMKRLENKDLAMNTSMITLGSCTMKLNATTEMIPVSWAEFNQIHPFVPIEQVQGYQQIIQELEQMLSEITGFAATSLQPNSGAQGEYTGLQVIRAYHISRGEGYRNVVLIPSSAHGTNPASAAMLNMQIVVVKCDDKGNIDVTDLKAKAEQHKDKLAALMVTYPSTHGVFEESIQEICDIIHQYGGQVYMDGANMNAQVGLTSPAIIGADVCHLNLHKTFAIPHGGGGPGMGPICVAAHLADFLPTHCLIPTGGRKGISAVSAAPWGSASILLISYAYIRMLGAKGLTNATKMAIVNANYVKSRLEKHYSILYSGTNGRCAHEMIVDLREFKKYGIEALDVAKRLMDYGFHAPTMSFPVPGTIMIEPTESESKEELDRFCDALIQIRQEIREVELGIADAQDNVLKNAPHTLSMVVADEWAHKYSREKAAFPLPYVRKNKFWASVARVNDLHGDRNLVCTCPPIESYQSLEA
ncbi:MAG: aminomethyl-transferring glycine dehydrogenase [Bacteroidia bacterium]|nr:aminomethyl-transferring glycine dehydrogenase [Bacteroidia bacterium]